VSPAGGICEPVDWTATRWLIGAVSGGLGGEPGVDFVSPAAVKRSGGLGWEQWIGLRARLVEYVSLEVNWRHVVVVFCGCCGFARWQGLVVLVMFIVIAASAACWGSGGHDGWSCYGGSSSGGLLG
jgi:hypothetical protein